MLLITASSILLLAGFLTPPWNSFQTAHDERLLGTGPVGTTLVDRFRANMLTETEVGQVRSLVRQLGADDFRQRERAFRELQHWRPGAEVVLRRHLVEQDLERARRIGQLLQHGLGRWSPLQEEAAVRLLKRQPSAATAQLLLEYLPFADDPGVLREIASTLRACAESDADVAAALRAELPSVASAWRQLLEPAVDPRRDDPSPTAIAADQARRFFALVAQGNTGELSAAVALPFALGNGYVLGTTRERDDFFRQAIGNYRDTTGAATLTFLHVVRGEEYLRLAASDDAEALRPLPAHELRAVHVRLSRGLQQEEQGVVLVRVGSSTVRVVGLGHTGIGPVRKK